MKLKNSVLFCILFGILHIQAAHVIMLMGPSCAGKSTISNQLCLQLNSTSTQWIVVDFDTVDENINLLIATTNQYLSRNINVIIDTNTYEKNMEDRFQELSFITKIAISAPLNVLLQRDELRTQKYNRTPKRAKRCRNFVLHSFEKCLSWSVDLRIDSSIHSVKQCCTLILDFLRNT